MSKGRGGKGRKGGEGDTSSAVVASSSSGSSGSSEGIWGMMKKISPANVAQATAENLYKKQYPPKAAKVKDGKNEEVVESGEEKEKEEEGRIVDVINDEVDNEIKMTMAMLADKKDISNKEGISAILQLMVKLQSQTTMKLDKMESLLLAKDKIISQQDNRIDVLEKEVKKLKQENNFRDIHEAKKGVILRGVDSELSAGDLFDFVGMICQDINVSSRSMIEVMRLPLSRVQWQKIQEEKRNNPNFKEPCAPVKVKFASAGMKYQFLGSLSKLPQRYKGINVEHEIPYCLIDRFKMLNHKAFQLRQANPGKTNQKIAWAGNNLILKCKEKTAKEWQTFPE